MHTKETYIAVDTETFLIQPGLVAPRMVCMSTYDSKNGPCLFHADLESATRARALPEIRAILKDKSAHIIGQNIAYDMGVLARYDASLLPLIFSKYRRGMVHDIGIRQRLIYLEAGRLSFDYINNNKPSFSLAAMVFDYFKMDISGTKSHDAWRMRYSELIDVPLDDWDDDAVQYALDDAQWTFEVFKAQEKTQAESLADERYQVNAAWALHLMGLWGLRTDRGAVAALELSIQADVDATDEILVKHGLIRPNGSKDTKAIRRRVTAAFNGQPPLTEGGHKKLAEGHIAPWDLATQNDGVDVALEILDLEKYAKADGETLEASNDPVLEALGESSSNRTLLSSFIPKLYKGAEVPINVRYDVLKETGRTSSYGDINIQNQPRKGGVRECFVPRPGFVFLFADYDSIELRCLAQTCLDLFGWSKLAEKYQEDPNFDPHSYLGAMIIGRTYGQFLDDKLGLNGADRKAAAKNARQLAKIPNFGYPGGMGAESLISFAKGYGVVITLAQAEHLKEVWLAAWPEMGEVFFPYISELCRGGSGTVRLPRTSRIRGSASYCAAANNHFQGPAADGAKRALAHIAEECYAVPGSKLFGSRPVAFIHDEVGVESPEGEFQDGAERLCHLMIKGMSEIITDVPVTVGVAAMRRWYKNAEEVRDQTGRLQIWTPEVS